MVELSIEKNFPISTKDIDLTKILSYHLFADAYGWTPSQVDNVDIVLLEGFASILDSSRKAERRMIENARRRH